MVDIHQVIVCHNFQWNKWPDTEDKDYQEILDTPYIYDCGPYRVHASILPVYLPYIETGEEATVLYPQIDNTAPVPPAVIANLLEHLKCLASTHNTLVWEHAKACPPEVADKLKSLFNLTALYSGDDCPNSSPKKTFPIVQGFDDVFTRMHVWDFETGETTEQKFTALGARTFMAPNHPSPGVLKAVQRAEVKEKISRCRQGHMPRVPFVFIGNSYVGNPIRDTLLECLNNGAPNTWGLYGHGMRDGVLAPHGLQDAAGAAVVEKYKDAYFSVNPQNSSLFNGRLLDLALCGVVQMIHDPWNELASIGLRPHKHFLPFTGSIANLEGCILAYRNQPEHMSKMLDRARDWAYRYLQENNVSRLYEQFFNSNTYQLLCGRSDT